MNPDLPFSARERAALSAWTAPTPPDDFAARVLARAGAREAAQPQEASRRRAVSSPPPLRAVAAAAVFALVVTGLWSLRAAPPGRSDGPGPGGGERARQRAAGSVLNDHDAGPRPEAGDGQAAEGGFATL
jgi:hypothetical protein